MPSETLDSQPDTNLANLCQRCSEINLAWSPEAVRRLLSERSSSVIFGIEGSPSDAWAPSCTMCQLFKAIDPRKGDPMEVILQTPRSYDGQGAVGYAANSSLLLKVKSTDAPFYTGRHLSVQSDPTQPIKLVDPQHIDLHTINGWLSTCLDKHKHVCSLDFYPEIYGLRVIDVRTKKIEVAERCTRYVALSYVWGQSKQSPPVIPTPEPATQPPQEKDNLGCLPNNLPSTILDAMAMTASLVFQYLWVDRYCIPQGEGNSKNRDEQIRQMDKVYRNAEITICAAAGEGPEHGLPGVGSIARVPQAHARIGNHTLISTMHDPIDVTSSTKWASRGWTYQEVICSRRRLVFTDEQVFFECQQMSCRCIP